MLFQCSRLDSRKWSLRSCLVFGFSSIKHPFQTSQHLHFSITKLFFLLHRTPPLPPCSKTKPPHLIHCIYFQNKNVTTHTAAWMLPADRELVLLRAREDAVTKPTELSRLSCWGLKWGKWVGFKGQKFSKAKKIMGFICFNGNPSKSQKIKPVCHHGLRVHQVGKLRGAFFITEHVLGICFFALKVY